MTGHAVVIAGGGPTGLMLAGELALAGVDVAIVERRVSQELVGSRAGGLHARTIEVLDQRGIADRFLAQGQPAQVAGFGWIRLDISDFPTRHNYGLALQQNHIERILAGWVDELAVPIYRGREVAGFAQDDSGVDVALSDGALLRAKYLVGCDGGRSLVRKAAGIAFPGWDPTTSCLIAEVEVAEEPEWGIRRDALGVRSLSRSEHGPVRIMVTERHLGRTGRPTGASGTPTPASRAATSSSGGAHTGSSAPSARNGTASPTTGSTHPRDPDADTNTPVSLLPCPSVLASAGDYTARPGACRKPRVVPYNESGEEWVLSFPRPRQRSAGDPR